MGLCLAALEAIDGLDLFQCRGGFNSTIHVFADEKARCQDILESLLPRESASKGGFIISDQINTSNYFLQVLIENF